VCANVERDLWARLRKKGEHKSQKSDKPHQRVHTDRQTDIISNAN